jgi:MYXO-CTERM domain-containing protein
VSLSSTSAALDKGEVIPGVNDQFKGSAPDLGALERGCPALVFGPRPEGQEAVTNLVDCSAPFPNVGEPDGGAASDGGAVNNEDGGTATSPPVAVARGCSCSGGADPSWLLLLPLALLARALSGRRRPSAGR